MASSAAPGTVNTAPRSNGAGLPGPRFLTPLGFIAAARKDPFGFMLEAVDRYGDRVEMRSANFFKFFLFANPADAKYILQENHKNYWKSSIARSLERVIGKGLLTSEGDLWKRQRQLVQPAFHRERIAAMADMMTEMASDTADRWQAEAVGGPPREVLAEMSAVSLQIVGKALFGTALRGHVEEFRDSVTGMLRYMMHLNQSPLTPPLWVPTAANRRGREALSSLDRVVWEIVNERRAEGGDQGDLLSMLLGARDEATNEAMDDQQLRDEMVGFLVAGHDTVANALAWTWYLLDRHPEVERRLHEQIDEVLGTRPPTLADLEDLPYVRMVFQESMRLYPPLPGTLRQPYEPDVVGGTPVGPRDVIAILPYALHRNPTLWEDPERFDPERFSPERSDGRPDYAYIPFGGGPRKCIGSQFAMMEGQLVLATLAQRFRLRSTTADPVDWEWVVSLRPRRGLWMTLEPRSPGH